MPDAIDDGFARRLFAGSGYVVGEFRCPAWARRWRTENWIGPRAHIVVPGTAVAIAADGADPHVCTANEVLAYDAGVCYRRRLVSDEGDRCVYFEVSDELAARLGLVSGRGRHGPRLRFASLQSSAYLHHRLLHAVIAAAPTSVDPLSVDEWGLALLARTAAHVSAHPRQVATRGNGAPAQRRAVEQVVSILATRLADPLTLADLGALVHYSPYFLARVFRRHTGSTIGRYRMHLRLRRSLELVLAVGPGSDLTEVAAMYGFSSHSHYTRAFREAFGCPPSALRRAVGARDVRRLPGLAQVLTT